MQCVSCYPTPMTEGEFGGVAAIRAEVGGVVGYSDHTDDERGGHLPWAMKQTCWKSTLPTAVTPLARTIVRPLSPVSSRPTASRGGRVFVLMHPEVKDPKLPPARGLAAMTFALWIPIAPFSYAMRGLMWVGAKLSGKAWTSVSQQWNAALSTHRVIGNESESSPSRQDVRTVSRQSITTRRAISAGGHHPPRKPHLQAPRRRPPPLPPRRSPRPPARAMSDADVPLLEEHIKW